jgi:hypothetical protein
MKREGRKDGRKEGRKRRRKMTVERISLSFKDDNWDMRNVKRPFLATKTCPSRKQN